MTSVNEAASALATTFSGQLLEPGDTEDQQPTVKGSPFQPQSSGFNEVNRRNLFALSKQSFISSERSSLYCLLVETQHGQLNFSQKRLWRSALRSSPPASPHRKPGALATHRSP